MRAITIRQPFASAIVLGLKDEERRTWRLPDRHVGHPIAVHAGLGDGASVPMPGAAEAAAELLILLPDAPRGAIVGIVVFGAPTLDHASCWVWPVKARRALLCPISLRAGRGGVWECPVADDAIG